MISKSQMRARISKPPTLVRCNVRCNQLRSKCCNSDVFITGTNGQPLTVNSHFVRCVGCSKVGWVKTVCKGKFSNPE